jgi:hypothetical protein
MIPGDLLRTLEFKITYWFFKCSMIVPNRSSHTVLWVNKRWTTLAHMQPQSVIHCVHIVLRLNYNKTFISNFTHSYKTIGFQCATLQKVGPYLTRRYAELNGHDTVIKLTPLLAT